MKGKALLNSPLLLFRGSFVLFIIICTFLIGVLIKSDVERTKLDTAADFSSRVQHLETTIGQLEEMATILAQSLTFSFDFEGSFDIDKYLKSSGSEFLIIDSTHENYRSGLVSQKPKSAQEAKRLELLIRTGSFLPHFLIIEELESISIFLEKPLARLNYPFESENAIEELLKEQDNGYHQEIWDSHRKQNIVWRMIEINGQTKLSLSAGILAPESGLVGVIQFLFPRDIFDQQLFKASGPDSLVFLTDDMKPFGLIATTQYEDSDNSIGKKFDMQLGNPIPKRLQRLLEETNDWVNQSQGFFLLSVPISGTFRLVYLTDEDSFSFMGSDKLLLGILFIVFLILVGVTFERLIHRQLDIILSKDRQLSEKNKLLIETLQDLEKTQTELLHKEKIASLSDVVAGLAHQINTPLSIAVTAVTYMKDSLDSIYEKINTGMKKSELMNLLDSGVESTTLINNNLRKVSSLIDSFKLLSVDESENKVTCFNVKEYTEAVISGLRFFLDQKNIDVEILGEESIRVNNYAMSYTQIIVQLINNSVEHGIERTGLIQVKIGKAKEKVGVNIEFSDNGIGICKQDIIRVFEPFFTSVKASKQVGLGLTVVHNLVHGQMSGEIKVESDLGQGFKVLLFIPSLPE